MELLPTEDENCTLVEVTEEEVENSVKHIPSLATVVSMGGVMVCGCTPGSMLPVGQMEVAAGGQKHWSGLKQDFLSVGNKHCKMGSQHLAGGDCALQFGGVFQSGPKELDQWAAASCVISTPELAA